MNVNGNGMAVLLDYLLFASGGKGTYAPNRYFRQINMPHAPIKSSLRVLYVPGNLALDIFNLGDIYSNAQQRTTTHNLDFFLLMDGVVELFLEGWLRGGFAGGFFCYGVDVGIGAGWKEEGGSGMERGGVGVWGGFGRF